MPCLSGRDPGAGDLHPLLGSAAPSLSQRILSIVAVRGQPKSGQRIHRDSHDTGFGLILSR